MKLNTKLRYTTALVAAALSVTAIPAANAASVSIVNAGFEDSFNTGWSDTDPSAISSDERSGSKAAKITGDGGKFEQDVTVEANTDYVLTAYISGYGKIGASVDGTRYTRTGGGDDYEQVTVSFNSGDSTSITIFGNYYNEEGRFDDFALESKASTNTNTVVDGTCTDSEALVISSASDDGSNDGHGPENTIDKDTTADSRWSSNGIGKTITYDLGADMSVKELAVKWYKGSERSSYFDIHTSTNNSNWTSVLSGGISSGGDSSYEKIDVTDTEARYVRVTGNGNSAGSSWNSIVETQILGCTDDSTVDSGTVEPDDSETVDTETLEPGDAEYPSDLMSNYNQWKITYPDGVEDKTLFEATNEYFYVNDTGNGIVFRAPVRSNNGTTPNSDYIRSELRERTSDGDSDIYWTTSGTHVVYSKQAITHLPLVKDHLVATQIHGNKDDGIDDSMVLRLEGEHLFLSFNGGKLRSDLTIKEDYTLGTIHEVIFEVIDDKHYVYYSEDGGLNAAYTAGNASQYLVKDGSSNYVMDLNYDQSYFKIGNYTQSNAEEEGSATDDEDNYGEVVVYDFWVDHE
ncbi:polysaccharide lyase family 7 protein [uncultured Psychromonas sp.]|uniref:polysaccharide lyase family 7 protein n=1 Tax=uncultured Psychromonas sp. TaxID=173974 RepID=UPI00261AF9D5|nr:polysaccharide lyase family 7 protein [uncultured Psychromonas sp.]